MRENKLLEKIRKFLAHAIELREHRTLVEKALKISYGALALGRPDTFLGRSGFAPSREEMRPVEEGTSDKP